MARSGAGRRLRPGPRRGRRERRRPPGPRRRLVQLERGRSPGGEGSALLGRGRLAPADDHEHDAGENLGFDAVGLGDVERRQDPRCARLGARPAIASTSSRAAPGKPKKKTTQKETRRFTLANRAPPSRLSQCGAVPYLLETPRLVVGEFICAPDDDAWSTTNHIGDSPHVVFPLVPVRITQIDKAPVLATPNHTIFYEAGQLDDRQLYERPRRPLHLRQRRAANAARRSADTDAGSRDRRPRRRGDLSGPPPARAAPPCRHDRRSRCGSRRAVAADGDAHQREPAPRHRRAQTLAAHHALAEAAKARARKLRALGRPETLGRTLHTSPFHLARVFRARPDPPSPATGARYDCAPRSSSCPAGRRS